jgi:cell wall-associated NlpC family hydrolase
VRPLALTITFIVAALMPSYAAAATGGVQYPGSAPLNGGSSSEGSGGTSTSTSTSTQRHPQEQAETPSAPAPTAPGTAILLPNGKAKAPAGAPAAVRRALRAGNRLQGKPYRFGGGHQRWEDDAYDCSGASSYALRGIGGLNSPLDSTGFMQWGLAGPGRWITTYANPNHMYVIIAGLRLDTGSGGEKGPRWRTTPRPPGNFTARHPAGL